MVRCKRLHCTLMCRGPWFCVVLVRVTCGRVSSERSFDVTTSLPVCGCGLRDVSYAAFDDDLYARTERERVTA